MVVTQVIGGTARKYLGEEGIVINIDTGIYPITVEFAPEITLDFMAEELEPVDTNIEIEIESEESLTDFLRNT